jgi:type I restriction enzyme R subunit
VQGFYKKDELELLIQRRTTRKPLASLPINGGHRRALLPAPRHPPHRRDLRARPPPQGPGGDGHRRGQDPHGDRAGDLLMRCNWAKRVLFLADRVALVNQAVNAFKAPPARSAPVNLVTDRATEGRVYVSTYPTMMGLIDETQAGSAASAWGTST